MEFIDVAVTCQVVKCLHLAAGQLRAFYKFVLAAEDFRTSVCFPSSIMIQKTLFGGVRLRL